MLNHSSGQQEGESEDLDAEGQEFKYLATMLGHLKGLFMPGDYVPSLRPFDIGGIEKRMKALLRRWDALLVNVLDKHRAKLGSIADSEKDMVHVLLLAMLQEQGSTADTEKLDVADIKATIMVRTAANQHIHNSTHYVPQVHIDYTLNS